MFLFWIWLVDKMLIFYILTFHFLSESEKESSDLALHSCNSTDISFFFGQRIKIDATEPEI